MNYWVYMLIWIIGFGLAMCIFGLLNAIMNKCSWKESMEMEFSGGQSAKNLVLYFVAWPMLIPMMLGLVVILLLVRGFLWCLNYILETIKEGG